MPLRATTLERPRFHVAPSQDSETIEVLQTGVPLQLVGFEGDYFRVVLDDGRTGFVHRDYVLMEGQTPPKPPAQPQASEPGTSATPVTPAVSPMLATVTGHPNFHTEPSETSPTTDVLSPATALRLVGLENSYWRVVLDDGRIGFVHTDHVLIAGLQHDQQGVQQGALTTISVRNPFNQAAHVTTSSLEGHHTPYGGDAACDMDVSGVSRGTPVMFRAAANNGAKVRGKVTIIRLACAQAVLANGGNRIQMEIETQRLDGTWVSTGRHINYAHLDPINVALNQLVEDGFELGKLGPAIPSGFQAGAELKWGCVHQLGDPLLDEYHSDCAQHSHTHVEADGSPWINHAGARIAADDEVMRFSL